MERSVVERGTKAAPRLNNLTQRAASKGLPLLPLLGNGALTRMPHPTWYSPVNISYLGSDFRGIDKAETMLDRYQQPLLRPADDQIAQNPLIIGNMRPVRPIYRPGGVY